jgi:hypothetical protein
MPSKKRLLACLSFNPCVDEHARSPNYVGSRALGVHNGEPCLWLAQPDAVSLDFCAAAKKEIFELWGVATVRLWIERKGDATAWSEMMLVEVIQKKFPFFRAPNPFAAMPIKADGKSGD